MSAEPAFEAVVEVALLVEVRLLDPSGPRVLVLAGSLAERTLADNLARHLGACLAGQAGAVVDEERRPVPGTWDARSVHAIAASWAGRNSQRRAASDPILRIGVRTVEVLTEERGWRSS